MPLDVFAPDYATARAEFRRAAAARGMTLHTYPLSQRGPNLEELTIDVAISGADDAPLVCVVSSGTHGVEGFLGSAVQHAWLADSGRLARNFPGIRTVFVHALNPFGFAWLRRTDENNVDLNRNFLLPGQSYRGSPHAYRELHGFLNPPGPPHSIDLYWMRAPAILLKLGALRLFQAVAGGQYDYPRGVYYGGSAPSASHQIVRQHVRQWLGTGRGRVLHLDLHTGLGGWGKCTLLPALSGGDRRASSLQRELASPQVRMIPAGSDAPPLAGDLGVWLEQHVVERRYDYVTIEIGTYRMLYVFDALRDENRAHHHALPFSRATRLAKKRLLEAFCPADRSWRERALAHGLTVIDRGFAALQSAPSATVARQVSYLTADT